MVTESRARLATLTTLAALILVLLVGIVGREPSASDVLFGTLAVTPLCAFVPFLARRHRRSYAALTLCLVLYLTLALMELIANPAARIWASLTLLTSFVLFVLLIVYLRVTRELT